MSNELEVAGSTVLAIRDDQTRFDEVQLAALKSLGLEDVPAGEADLFFHVAKRSGLDPFSKQIYLIARTKTKRRFDSGAREWVDDGEETSYTIQTGIDGYRVLGHRAARLRGDVLEVTETEWHGKAGGWTDVWLDSAPPAAARVTIRVNGSAFTATAMYSEYVQLTGSGDRRRPNSMWSKMPANQLAKCAEAAAWRLAYPADFSGIVLEDAVQVIDEDGGAVRVSTDPAAPATRRGLDSVRAKVRENRARPKVKPKALEFDDAPAPSAAPEAPAPIGEATVLHLSEQMTDAGLIADADRAKWLADTLGRSVGSWADVTDADVSTIADALTARKAELSK